MATRRTTIEIETHAQGARIHTPIAPCFLCVARAGRPAWRIAQRLGLRMLLRDGAKDERRAHDSKSAALYVGDDIATAKARV